MTHMVLLPVVALLLIVPIGILGTVLFIVGLVKKKPVLWGSGIAVAVLGLLAFVVGMGMLMWVGARGASMNARAVAVKSMTAQPMPFKDRTGLDMPNGVVAFGRCSGSFTADQGGTTQFVMLHLAVQPDFDQFLAANFTKANWQDVSPTFQAGRSRAAAFLPADSQLQAMTLYSLTNPPDSNFPAAVTTVVAHDAGASQAWMVSLEKAPPETKQAQP